MVPDFAQYFSTKFSIRRMLSLLTCLFIIKSTATNVLYFYLNLPKFPPRYSATSFFFKSFHTFGGVIGMSICLTPRCQSASTTALTMAAGAPTVPESPTPFAPSGWLSRSHFSRSEEHTSELQSLTNLVCRLLLEKKNNHHHAHHTRT